MVVRIAGSGKKGGSSLEPEPVLGKLYKLNCEIIKSPTEKAKVTSESQVKNKTDLWHQRLAHVNSFVNLSRRVPALICLPRRRQVFVKLA